MPVVWDHVLKSRQVKPAVYLTATGTTKDVKEALVYTGCYHTPKNVSAPNILKRSKVKGLIRSEFEVERVNRREVSSIQMELIREFFI